jgi:tetratricopeptide (TPR) repeat protein
VSSEKGTEAAQLLRRAIELDPHYVEAYAQLALYLSFQSIIDPSFASEAQQAIDRALELDPNHELALLAAGVSCVNMAQYDRALACCERAVELNPNLASAWAYLGLAVLGAKKDGATALAHLDRAFALSPRDEAAYLWYHMKAPCHAQMGDIEGARDMSLESVRRYPGWFFSWLCHAQYLALLGDVAGTRNAWQEARRRFPMLTLELYRQMVGFSPLSADLNRRITDAFAAAGVE